MMMIFFCVSSLVEVPEDVVDLLAVDHAVFGRRHRPRPRHNGAVVHARHRGVVVGDGRADANAAVVGPDLYEVNINFVFFGPL